MFVRFIKDAPDAASGNHDAVRILIQTNQDPTSVYVVARLVCLTDLPSSDAALVGQLFTKETIVNASTTPIIASIEDISSFRHANASSASSDNSGANAFTVALSPRSWKYGTLVLCEQSTAVCVCVFFLLILDTRGHSFVILLFVLVSLF